MTPLFHPLPEPAIVSSPFTESRRNPFGRGYAPHRAVDFAAPEGTIVRSSISGKVTVAGWYGGYGNAVVVANESQKVIFGHLSQVNVKRGSTVQAGDIVGKVGSTGYSTGAHLHMEYWVAEEDLWNPKDPLKFFPAVATKEDRNRR